MRPRFISPGDKHTLFLRDRPKCIRSCLRLFESRRVFSRPGNHKVIVHQRSTIQSPSLLYELLLVIGRVCQQEIGVSPAAQLQSLPATDCHDLHLNPTLLLKGWQQDIQEPAVLSTRSRC